MRHPENPPFFFLSACFLLPGALCILHQFTPGTDGTVETLLQFGVGPFLLLVAIVGMLCAWEEPL